MLEPKEGQRYKILEAPFPVFFEVTNYPGICDDIEGDLVIIFLTEMESIQVDHANADEIKWTLPDSGKKTPFNYNWPVNLNGIAEMFKDEDDLEPTVGYWNIRIEHPKKKD